MTDLHGRYCTPTCPTHHTTFCPVCGKANLDTLNTIRLAGAIGVVHTSNPKIEQFFATGNPDVFTVPQT